MDIPSSGLSLPDRPKPYLMAHRGNRALFPENTRSAFIRAFEDGCDILETDLQLSADGEFVCIHDATLDRTTDGHGSVDGFSLQELKRFNAAVKHPKLDPEIIPSLDDLCSWLPSRVGLALELKSDRFLEPEIAARLLQLLRSAGVIHRTVILSFSTARLRTIKNADPEVPLGLITMNRVVPPVGFEMIGPFWPLLLINPLYVRWAHHHNQLVAPLDPTPECRLGYYHWLGCDAVLSDHPHITAEKLNLLRA